MTSKIKKYINLFRNIKNWDEYILHKSEYETRNLNFITKPNKLKFEVPYTLYAIFKEIFMEDFYQVNTLLKKLPDQPVIIDIGANAGFFPLLILSKNKLAKIYSYEPLPTNIKRFEKIKNENSLMQNQVKLFAQAVASKKGMIEIFAQGNSDETTIASAYQSFDVRNTTSIQVASATLESILNDNNLSSADLVKMDCEGSEYDIIYNAPDTVLSRIKGFAIEAHDMPGEKENYKSLELYLQSKGYTTEKDLAQNQCYYIKAWRFRN